MNVRLSLPSPKVSAALVLVFLGFGVLMGRATRQSQYALAASARPGLKLVLPAAQASALSSSPSTSSSESGGESPEAEPEPTPTPAATAGKHAAAKSPSSANNEAGGEEGEAGKGGSSEATAATPATKLPAIKHVFEIVLSDEPYAAVFGPESSAHYLAHTLEHKGELLVRYDAVAHEELANEVALLSGQGPTAETAANCATYAAIATATVGASVQ